MTEGPADDHMTYTEHSSAHGEPVGVIRGLFISVLEAARTRLDLAAVEAEIFLLRAIYMLLWSMAAVACALLALAFLVVAAVVALWDTHRMGGVLGGASIFLVLAGLSGYVASRTFRARPSMLEGTLSQLESDRQHAMSDKPS